MSPTRKKRARRSPEQLIADLQARIETIKSKAERQQAKRDPALRHVASAVRSIDKALAETSDKVLRAALNEAHLTLGSCLTASGMAPPRSGAKPRGRRARGAASEELAEAILPYLRANPGQRGEEIAAALGTDTNTLRPPMKRLIADGQVRTEGQRRGMTYYPV